MMQTDRASSISQKENRLILNFIIVNIISMNKTKKMLSIVIFIISIFFYSLIIMALISEIKFYNWIVELIVYMFLGIIWIYPSMIILKPFKSKK